MGGIVIKSYKFVVRNSMINQKQQQITNVSKQSGNHCSIMTANKMGIRGRTRSPLFCTFSSTKQVILFNLFFCAPPKKLRRSSYTPLLSHNKALM